MMDAPVSVLDYPDQQPAVQARDAWYLPRSKFATLLLLLLPTSVCGLSWLAGGVPVLTDFGFITLTFICASLVLRELIVFPRRFGLGGVVLFGGFIVFYCYDYIIHWMGGAPFVDPVDPLLTKDVVARAAFYHCLFLMFATMGLVLTAPRRLPNFMTRLPEANSSGIYLTVIMLGFMVGMAPYFLFTRQNGFEAIYLSIFSGRGGSGAQWLIGRTGSANYSWGGYVVQVLQVGQVAAQFAAFYALIISRSWISKMICWSIWGLYLSLGFGTGVRGEVAFVALPVCGLLFLKYQMQASLLLRSVSLRAYILSGAVLLVVMVIFQIQITYRGRGFTDVRMDEVSLSRLEGTSMFTEGLHGWALIPDHYPYIQNRFPGEPLVGPIPETLIGFLMHPIPRALWPTKPLDPVAQWYNSVVTGRDIKETEGTTISTGLVGEWYFRYGPLGVIQGALLFGWLCRVFERSLVATMHRPFGLLMSVAMGVCLLRFFRNFNFPTAYQVLVPGVVLALLVWFFNMFSPPQVDAEPIGGRA